MAKQNYSKIDYIEMNDYGAWVVYGALGFRQYYYYTKSEARAAYLNECDKRLVIRRA